MMKSVASAAGPAKNGGTVTIETVADILERELKHVIAEWLMRVNNESDLAHIPLNHDERTGHLPRLIHDVINRLRLDAETKAPVSKAAAEHGDLRHAQGYTVAMMVEESRLLQVSIFTTLHQNVKQLEFSSLLAQLLGRTHQNVVIVALANKLVRMAWAVLCKNERYRAPVLAVTA